VLEWSIFMTNLIVHCFINTLSLLYLFVQLDLFAGPLLQRLRILLAKCDKLCQLLFPWRHVLPSPPSDHASTWSRTHGISTACVLAFTYSLSYPSIPHARALHFQLCRLSHFERDRAPFAWAQYSGLFSRCDRATTCPWSRRHALQGRSEFCRVTFHALLWLSSSFHQLRFTL